MPTSLGQGSGIAMSCGVGHGRGSDPTLLWLWSRQAAADLIQPIAWKLPYATHAAFKKKKKKEFCYHIHPSDGPNHQFLIKVETWCQGLICSLVLVNEEVNTLKKASLLFF